MLPRNRIGRKSKVLIWSHCNQPADFPLLQSWTIPQARLCAGNQYFEKFSFNPWHKTSPLLPYQKHKKYKQFIVLKHWNMLFGKAIPTTMILCVPKGGFFTQVSGIGGKIQAQAEWFFWRTQRQVCRVLVFHCRYGLSVRFNYLLHLK